MRRVSRVSRSLGALALGRLARCDCFGGAGSLGARRLVVRQDDDGGLRAERATGGTGGGRSRRRRRRRG
eukprot:6198274-Pleurochrysis_carterae.AAC.1